jgi:formate hydrogenlyase subunit 4
MMIKLMNILLLLFLPFLFTGVINKTKAFWAGRKGPPLLQPLFDMIKLFSKAPVFGHDTSFIFQMAAPLSMAAVLTAALFVPGIRGNAALSFEGDMIVFVGFLALSRFFLMASALDTGSSFEGMGAAREAFFSTLVEPAFLIFLAVSVIHHGEASFSSLLNTVPNPGIWDIFTAVLSGLTLLILLLTEGGRVPVDDPATHLELTMISEVMVLDNSGPDLALWNYMHSLKTVFLAVLICGLFLPVTLSFGISLLLLFSGVMLIAVVTGCVESFTARLRLTHVPQFILFAAVLSILMVFTLLANR